MTAIRIAPSILSADFARLGEQVRDATEAGADLIHVDVMDGRFVPNITMGPLVVEAIRPVTHLPLDVHLMIESPDAMLEPFVEAGADIVQVHVEACRHLHRTTGAIKELGALAGVVLNPATPVSAVEEILTEVDVVTVMTVNPGFGGQDFIMSQLRKIERLRDFLAAMQDPPDLEVDGGVHTRTAPLCVRAGANILVAGSAVFNRTTPVHDAMTALRDSIAGVTHEKDRLSKAGPGG